MYVPRSSNVTVQFNITTSNFQTYNWSYDNVTGSGTQFSASFTAPATGYTSIVKIVYLVASDGCGSVRREYWFNITSLGFSFAINASPNPASEKLNISITKVFEKNNYSDKEIANEKSIYKSNKTVFGMYDVNTNQLMKQWIYNESDLMNYSLDIRGIKPGIYFLKMERDGQKAKTKILIQ